MRHLIQSGIRAGRAGGQPQAMPLSWRSDASTDLANPDSDRMVDTTNPENRPPPKRADQVGRTRTSRPRYTNAHLFYG